MNQSYKIALLNLIGRLEGERLEYKEEYDYYTGKYEELMITNQQLTEDFDSLGEKIVKLSEENRRLTALVNKLKRKSK